ncbi:hypothetical protein QTP70_017879 [Hemibagrus guttatus]|uniref:Uncharacterized protein n=1 Tax=Hemibagrus guttatus TaxID=175788 RepID=A0AAE0V304_9TELE|nr:hypothetical protein QTP70_017879 [Hemibagrus guttatus]
MACSLPKALHMAYSSCTSSRDRVLFQSKSNVTGLDMMENCHVVT